MKRLFTLLLAVLMLFSLTACNTKEPAATTPTTEPTTEPNQPEVSQIISQVQWVVNDPFDMKDQWDCQYDAMSNTLVITGKVYDTREIVFFEGECIAFICGRDHCPNRLACDALSQFAANRFKRKPVWTKRA